MPSNANNSNDARAVVLSAASAVFDAGALRRLRTVLDFIDAEYAPEIVALCGGTEPAFALWRARHCPPPTLLEMYQAAATAVATGTVPPSPTPRERELTIRRQEAAAAATKRARALGNNSAAQASSKQQQLLPRRTLSQRDVLVDGSGRTLDAIELELVVTFLAVFVTDELLFRALLQHVYSFAPATSVFGEMVDMLKAAMQNLATLGAGKRTHLFPGAPAETPAPAELLARFVAVAHPSDVVKIIFGVILGTLREPPAESDLSALFAPPLDDAARQVQQFAIGTLGIVLLHPTFGRANLHLLASVGVHPPVSDDDPDERLVIAAAGVVIGHVPQLPVLEQDVPLAEADVLRAYADAWDRLLPMAKAYVRLMKAQGNEIQSFSTDNSGSAEGTRGTGARFVAEAAASSEEAASAKPAAQGGFLAQTKKRRALAHSSLSAGGREEEEEENVEEGRHQQQREPASYVRVGSKLTRLLNPAAVARESQGPTDVAPSDAEAAGDLDAALLKLRDSLVPRASVAAVALKKAATPSLRASPPPTRTPVSSEAIQSAIAKVRESLAASESLAHSQSLVAAPPPAQTEALGKGIDELAKVKLRASLASSTSSARSASNISNAELAEIYRLVRRPQQPVVQSEADETNEGPHSVPEEQLDRDIEAHDDEQEKYATSVLEALENLADAEDPVLSGDILARKSLRAAGEEYGLPGTLRTPDPARVELTGQEGSAKAIVAALGEAFGDFTQRLVGCGEDGCAFRGTDSQTGDAVVVKLTDHADSHVMVRRVAVLQAIVDPRLERYRDLYLFGGDHQIELAGKAVFFNMAVISDWVLGIPLSRFAQLWPTPHVLSRRDLVTAIFFDVARDLLGGLATLHANCLVHTDIKGETILIRVDVGTTQHQLIGTLPTIHAMFSDLDAACLTCQNATGCAAEPEACEVLKCTMRSRAAHRMLAPEYIAALGAGVTDTAALDLTKVDIWALGAVFYELIEGRDAFEPRYERRRLSDVSAALPKLDYVGTQKRMEIFDAELLPYARATEPMKQLIVAMMNKTPELRPAAEELLRRLGPEHPH